jgi:hypothetical protein
MSVIKACIERFRTQEPLPKELRDHSINVNAFWWKPSSTDDDSDITFEIDEHTTIQRDDLGKENEKSLDDSNTGTRSITEEIQLNPMESIDCSTDTINDDTMILDDDELRSPIPKSIEIQMEIQNESIDSSIRSALRNEYNPGMNNAAASTHVRNYSTTR